MSLELRDRFFALSTGRAPAEDIDAYRAEVDATDADPAATVDGLAVCWHPTARFKQVRFVDAERLGAGVRDLFARPVDAMPDLAAVFADPRELSYRTFENILPLDRLFADVPLDLELTGREEFAEGAHAFSLRLPAAARSALEGLDSLDLYVPPLNASSRGGDRFIFHSGLLAGALGAAVRDAMPDALLDGFAHVNPVFRGNRFEPGDANFHSHLDTPYYDAARNHVSRYTVLLYLTGGEGDPALDLAGGGALTAIEPFTCVIFDQRYEHEGRPYRDGRKVFLRTELVFSGAGLDHDPEIGALFGKATYWTGESVFAPELARHADDYYNRVAAAHWNGLSPAASASASGPEPFVHKRFRGVEYVANGYDYWFPKDGLSPAECAAITLLDYFNCKVGGAAYRTLCETEVIEAGGTDWIPGLLSRERGERGESPVVPFDKAALFPEPEEPETGDLPDCACPLCAGDLGATFDTSRNAEIIKHYARAQEQARADIGPAPILLLGEDVLLDPDLFVVEGDRIHVLGKEALTPVAFASCFGGPPMPSADTYVATAATLEAVHVLVPPILFAEDGDCYHLKFDFFRNTWTVGHEQSTVSVPMIRPFDEEDLPEDWEDDYDEDEEDEDWDDEEEEEEAVPA
ncbi:MAG TPA: hypothetical protein VFV01_18810 [Spirillospora sp.]|nr:hypothetical protein [Spirillospora sp.]